MTAVRPYRYRDVVRSEWTKFRTVPATYWTFGVAILLGVGLGALASDLRAAHYASESLAERGAFQPTLRSLLTLELAQLAFAVLGVITVTSEYSSGMIRSSLTAVPRRVRMMTAKILVFGVAALVLGQAIAFADFSLGQYLIHLHPVPSASLGDHLVLRQVIGAGLYLTVIGVLGAALAVIVRNAAAGIAIVVAMLFIIPGLVEAALPTSWAQPIDKYWPTFAGQRIIYATTDPQTALTAWWGFADLAVFTLVVIVVAMVLLDRRDAVIDGPDVWLIRHGQTEWSANGRHTGRTDLELTPAGEDQARALVPVLAGVGFDLVLSSPRRRAQRTAELAGLAGLAGFEVDDDLQEWDYGDFEGLTTPQIHERCPGWSIWEGPWPGGETAADVAARADRLIRRVRTSGVQRVALVGHGHFSRVTGARWVGADVPVGRWLDFDTASWSVLGWDRGVATLSHWNVPAAR